MYTPTSCAVEPYLPVAASNAFCALITESSSALHAPFDRPFIDADAVLLTRARTSGTTSAPRNAARRDRPNLPALIRSPLPGGLAPTIRVPRGSAASLARFRVPLS